MSFMGLIRFSLQQIGSTALDRLSSVKIGKVLSKVVPDVKKAIRAGIKARYTYKGAIPIRSKRGGNSVTLTVKGPRSSLKKFAVRGGKPRRRGRYVTGSKLYAQVVKGQGGVIERGFINKGGKYMRRLTASRFPIKGLTTLSVAQMAGHEPMPVKLVEAAIEKGLAAHMEALI